MPKVARSASGRPAAPAAQLLDTQFVTDHLATFAIEASRRQLQL
jgi:hypothetical protein